MVRVRFAPSPTGMLHIGGARTALFNYVFAKANKGKFLLRIEDTDKERSTDVATKAILDGMKWLGLTHDEETVYQSSRIERHKQVAKQLIESGNAYYAYDTKEELDAEREAAEANGKSYRYSQKWRESNEAPPAGVSPVVRIKVPKGEIIVPDLVKGNVTFDDSAIDDFIILRSDGTPTYMFAVVVDDIDMGITHIIRGDDHLSNTPKQIVIYKALSAKIPQFGHIPLIYDEEGKKMSKRKNAVAVSDYKNLGILPSALKNYLLTLGWSHGGDEIITEDEAAKIFKISDVGLSPSRFDMQKLYNINLHYIKQTPDEELLNLILPDIEGRIGKKINQNQLAILQKIIPELKKCNNLVEVLVNSTRYILDKVEYSQEAINTILKNTDKTLSVLDFTKSVNIANFKAEWDDFLKRNSYKFAEVGPILRAILIGITSSTALTVIVDALGEEAVQKRALQASEVLKTI